MLSAYEFRQFAQNPPHERLQQCRRTRTRISLMCTKRCCRGMSACSKRWLTAEGDTPSCLPRSRRTLWEHVNLSVCCPRPLAGGGAVQVRDLELVIG
jgi:hypothetical protein